MPNDAWNPDQYRRFAAERAQPFHVLLALVQRKPAMRVIDLGCGTGELTRHLHDTLGAKETLGVDTSEAMLAEAAGHATAGLRFAHRDIGECAMTEWDLVFSNAALQWLPEHERLFHRLHRGLAAGGQLAVQMPSNHGHASHLAAQHVAGEEPFRTALGGYVRTSPVRPPEFYARLLHRLGFVEQRVRVEVYLHVLGSRDDVVEWVKGTLLTDYVKRLPPALEAAFLERYRARLAEMVADERPFPYPFPRLLLWARK